MDDAEHLRRFEDHSLPHEQWNHRAHLKVAYLYLQQFPFPEALERMRTGIKAYNAAHGIQDTPTGGYHETLTQVWLQLVSTTLRQFGPADTADAFFDAQSQLSSKRAPLLFYSRDLIMSAEAKRAFVAPDLAALPQPPATENLRAAPTAPARSSKPSTVTIAVRLLWLSLAIGVPRLWIDLPIIQHMEYPELVGLTFLLTFGFLAWLTTMIDEGFHWARVTFLILLALGLPFWLMHLFKYFNYSFLSGMFNLVQSVLQVAGAALLFTASSRPWFLPSTPPDKAQAA